MGDWKDFLGPGLGKPRPSGLALPYLSLSPLPLPSFHCPQMPHALTQASGVSPGLAKA